MSAGVIIYKAFMPTVKMMRVFCLSRTSRISDTSTDNGCRIGISVGYAITKTGIFTPQCAKGVSIVSLVSINCLILLSSQHQLNGLTEHLPPMPHLRIYGPIFHIYQYLSVRRTKSGGSHVYGNRCGASMDRQGDFLRSDRFSVGHHCGMSIFIPWSLSRLTAIDGSHIKLE